MWPSTELLGPTLVIAGLATCHASRPTPVTYELSGIDPATESHSQAQCPVGRGGVPLPVSTGDHEEAHPANAVHGTVLETYERPAVGRVVSVGPRKTMADAQGRFHLPDIARRYDLVISDTDGAIFTMYKGLTGRNPRVLHRSGPIEGEGQRLPGVAHRRLVYAPFDRSLSPHDYDAGEWGDSCAFSDDSTHGYAFELRCALPQDRPIVLKKQVPLRLFSPSEPSKVTPGFPFYWSPVPNAVYVLRLDVNSPTPTNPRVDVYTSATDAAWPDLSALGVAFPDGAAAYKVKVEAIGPYSSVDDAVGPNGVGAALPTDAWTSASPEVDLYVEVPPLDADGGAEAICVGTDTIVCPGLTAGVARRTLYDLRAINRKLRHYPKLAVAAETRCVTDCDGAGAFARILQAYRCSNPRFEANEPLDW